MEVTHLVVNGCSWTYGQGLDDPAQQAWPALIAKALDIPVVNLAVPGSGNDAIHRRTHEYVYENLPKGSKPLAIISWSQPWRREAWYEERKGKLVKDYYTVHHPTGPAKSTPDVYSQAVIPHWNEEDFLRKTLLYKASLQNLFNVFEIPFLMTDYSSDFIASEYVELIRSQKCAPLYSIVYNKFHIDSFPTKIKQFKPLPCLHDGPDAQRVLAEYTLSEIKKLHPDLSIKRDSEYLSVDKFVLQKKYAAEPLANSSKKQKLLTKDIATSAAIIYNT
jgi:hypothetical protein